MKLNDGLLLLFIGLKLTNQIDWNWFLVLSPLWVGFVLVLVAKCFTECLKEYKKL